ncbi:MAG: GNAT family N-acetyltransferase [Clostridiales bacterium]|nr:GNAT family N-acetyltransferase [Clostridiales bacterium]
MADILDRPEYAIERIAFDDALKYEGARLIVRDENAAVISAGRWNMCVLVNGADFHRYVQRYDLYGKVCVFGAKKDLPETVGLYAPACKMFAYLDPMPPAVELPSGVVVKRLAPSLAQTVMDAYTNRGGSYTVEHMAKIMREKGIFGAIADGKLAGFIGMHGDGTMGMLEVFDGYKRCGIGAALERFLINYIMTFGRVPICDVYTDNPASLALQEKLGLTPATGHAFWFEKVEPNAAR